MRGGHGPGTQRYLVTAGADPHVLPATGTDSGVYLWLCGHQDGGLADKSWAEGSWAVMWADTDDYHAYWVSESQS